MKEVDTQRQLQADADDERAQAAFAGADAGRQQGDSTPIYYDSTYVQLHPAQNFVQDTGFMFYW